MSQNSFVILKSDIRRELDNVRRLVDEAQEWRPRLSDWPYTVRVRTAGGILHDFYSAVERMFRYIATEIDHDLPGGPSWHIQLLHRMATDLDTIRPAVLDRAAARQLDEYLRFRHLFRNMYGFDLDWERCNRLLINLPEILAVLEEQMTAFLGFLDTASHQKRAGYE
jgi:hypothetical protein